MELDLSEYRWPLIVLAILLLLAGLGWLGYAYTPAGDKLLTRTEWQVLKVQSAYQSELKELQTAAEALAALLNIQSGGAYRPDPVRAQLAAQNIQRLASQGQPALAYPREKLALAAQAVSDWAVGAVDRETAVQALEGAIQALSPQQAADDPAQNALWLIFLPFIARENHEQ